jgi:hypothetical protein
MTPKLRRLAVCFCMSALALVFLSGCIGTKISYSPKEQMVVATSHNNFLWLGPCGSPWNYSDQINILLQGDYYKSEASQLEAYQDGKLKVDSGYVILNRTNKTVTIELAFEGDDHVPVQCKYNGIHRYVEKEPQEFDITRGWLEEFYRTNGMDFYHP